MRRAPFLFAVVLALAPGRTPAFAAGSSPPTVPQYAQFGHWLIACDNGRSCEARGLSQSGRAEIRIVRKAGEAPAGITLITRDIPMPAIEIGGQKLPLASPARVTPDNGDPSESISTAPLEARAFVDRARNAENVVLLPGRDVIPLAGFAATLLRMDRVQGRAGTPTALMAAKGSNPPPPAPPLPARPAWRPTVSLSHGEAASLIAATRRRAAAMLEGTGCDYLEKDEAHALDADHALVVLSCPVNAYQGQSFVFIVPRRGGVPAPFVARLPVLGAVTGKLGDTTFDAATGTLTSRSRGAGLANCGTRAEWVWSAGAFRLTTLDYQEECGGTSDDDWPALFRTIPSKKAS